MPNLDDISKIIKRCIITLVGKDNTDFRVQQISANDKAIDAEVWAPYGVSYNIPPGSLCVYLQIGGDQGNLVVLPDRSQDRVKNLKEGEVAFFNPLTQSRTIFRENGDIETVTEGTTGDMTTTVKGDKTVTVAGAMTVNVSGECNIDVDGDCNIDVNGDVNLDADDVNIDASQVNLGTGGADIARRGDAVRVTVIGGSSSGVHNGTITGGGTNTSR